MAIEDELHKNIDRVKNKGTKDKFFLDIVALIEKVQTDCDDGTKCKSVFTQLMKNMPHESLRFVADQVKNKVPYQVSSPASKGYFAKEVAAMNAIELDIKYARDAMKSVMLLAFYKQFQVRGKMNWKDIADEIEDIREEVIKASASAAAGNNMQT